MSSLLKDSLGIASVLIDSQILNLEFCFGSQLHTQYNGHVLSMQADKYG